MKSRLLMAAVALAALDAGEAAAQSQALPARAAEYVNLFSAACLEAFPDDGAIESLMLQRQGARLSGEDAVKKYKLAQRNDRAWTIKGAEGGYTLLVGGGGDGPAPPGSHGACTLLTDAPAAMNVLDPFRAAKQAYATKKGRALEKANTQTSGANQVEIQMLSQLAGVFGYGRTALKNTQAEFRLEFRPLLQ